MNISQALKDAQTIDQVVEIINNGGTYLFNAEQIAGQYAYTAQLESGYDIDLAAIEAHLDCLKQSGAEFDYPEAVKQGLALINE